LLDDGGPGWEERAIEWLIARILDALARDYAVGPLALTLLLRRYCTTDRAELADALGPALAAAAAREFDNPVPADADWLPLFVESAAVSDDARLRGAGERLIAALRRQWGARGEVGPAAWSIGACLMAADLVDPRELIPAAIDELERIVGAAYRPGVGLGNLVCMPEAVRGLLGDHVRAASALLTAHERTGRLPYAMLAEELMQFVLRTSWDRYEDGFVDRKGGDACNKSLLLNCEAARVLMRLAALHGTPAYRDAAVLAPGVDYAEDAARVLVAFEPEFRDHGVNAAVYGIALTEWVRRS
jgi:GNAT superfamily N-acetyltransferase